MIATTNVNTPSEALDALRAGNTRFYNGKSIRGDQRGLVSATRDGQQPFAAVLGCIDSRTSPVLLFDQSIGDLFSARVAGNFANTDILGSLEFACAVAGAKLVVVLGHSGCGAVRGACDGVELGNLTAMLEKLAPAVEAVTDELGDSAPHHADDAFLQKVADKNVDLTVAAIRERSEVLRNLEEEGRIAIVGAMYDVATGAVEFR